MAFSPFLFLFLFRIVDQLWLLTLRCSHLSVHVTPYI